MPLTIKIGHFQCKSFIADYQANIDQVVRGLEFAKRENIDVMSFPESLVTNYYVTEKDTRKYALPLDGPVIARLLKATKRFSTMAIIGFDEAKDGNVYNSALVAHRGKLLGVYRKAFPCAGYLTGGREFPVFKCKGVTFGIVICADGGYVEPARILAHKGARIIFAPHYNTIGAGHLIDHFQKVHRDHAARANENSVWFLRGCQAAPDKGHDTTASLGPCVAYGESYLMDPKGELVARTQRYVEDFISVNVTLDDDTPGRLFRSRASAELLPLLEEALKQSAPAQPAPAKPRKGNCRNSCQCK